ncbi:hypothetical protein JCM10207_002193 [Rhodosporidiobolus poonsookiae]
MSFRQSLVRLAQHARQPLMRFPDRAAKPSSHAAEPHPCAPQSTIDAFPRFQHAQQNPRTDFSQSSSYGGPNTPPSSSSSSGGAGGVVLSEEEQLPAWLRRSRYAPEEDELEAVMSGGASATTMPNNYKNLWYQPQI